MVAFDDGYASSFHVALAMLERFDKPATFLIATGFLDQRLHVNVLLTTRQRQARRPTKG